MVNKKPYKTKAEQALQDLEAVQAWFQGRPQSWFALISEKPDSRLTWGKLNEMFMVMRAEIKMAQYEEQKLDDAVIEAGRDWMIRALAGVTREAHEIRDLPRQAVLTTMAFQDLVWNGRAWINETDETTRQRIITRYGAAAYYDQTHWSVEGE